MNISTSVALMMLAKGRELPAAMAAFSVDDRVVVVTAFNKLLSDFNVPALGTELAAMLVANPAIIDSVITPDIAEKMDSLGVMAQKIIQSGMIQNRINARLN
jgi:hypothetical protein